jgi:hypothetical protein
LIDRILFSGFATELVTAALSVIFNTAVRWELVSADSPAPMFRTRAQLRNALKTAPAARDPFRNDERAGGGRVLAGRSQTYAAFVTPMEAFHPSGRAKFAEFDAIYAQPEGRTGLAVTLIEVKREGGGTSETSAVRSIEGKLKKFGLHEGVTRDQTRSSRDGSLGWAWITLRAR